MYVYLHPNGWKRYYIEQELQTEASRAQHNSQPVLSRKTKRRSAIKAAQTESILIASKALLNANSTPVHDI